MNRSEFIQQLKEMGYDPAEQNNYIIVFPYTVLVGKFAATKIKLGLQVTDLVPPPGPHVSPRLLPLHPGSDLPHPLGGVHESALLGSDWQYWSRPFKGWAKTDRSARTYMAYINTLFDTQ
jgi:hypothetical protein